MHSFVKQEKKSGCHMLMVKVCPCICLEGTGGRKQTLPTFKYCPITQRETAENPKYERTASI